MERKNIIVENINVNVIEKKFKSTISYNGKERPVRFTEESKKYIEELMKNHTRCICVYNSVDEYKYSTVGTKYCSVSPTDTCGSIESIDYDNCTVNIRLMPECCDPNSYRYIDPNDYDKYNIIIRGVFNKIAGDGEGNATDVRFIAFDLLKDSSKSLN